MNPRIPQIIAELAQFESKLRQSQSAEDIAKQLGNIKLYAAQLYLETDMEIIAQNREPLNLDPQPIEEVSPGETSFFKPSYEDDIDTQEVGVTALETAANMETAPIEDARGISNQEKEALIPKVETLIEKEVLIEDSKKELEVTETAEHAELEEQVPLIHNDDLKGEIKNETVEGEDAESREEDLQISQNILEKSVPVEPPISPDKGPDPEIDLFSQIHLKTVEKTDNLEDDSTVKQPTLHLEQRATEILAMFSFSRRFEFGNFLFGGDMKLFAVFITEMLAASNADEREDVFDTWYTQRQWSRRDESANDLKRNLRKMI